MIGKNYQYLNYFFFFSKDPSRWERYPYDPRYRDPRSYDQRYWYDAEHNPYQKREAYPYGSRFVQSIHVLPVLFSGQTIKMHIFHSVASFFCDFNVGHRGKPDVTSL